MAKPSNDALARELIKLNNRHGYNTTDYFRWFVDDVLAGFGVPLRETPPRQAVPHLFELSKQYAGLVHTAPPFRDLLGTTYMQLVSRWGQKGLGQYFTPGPVAQLLARLNLGDTLPEGPLVTVCDPACGSGVLLMAVAEQVLDHHGPDGLARLSLTGIDLDGFCARLFPCQVLANLFTHQLELGEVLAYHGNSLGAFDALKVVAHSRGVSVPAYAVLPANHPARAPTLKAAAQSAGLQMGLFDVVDDKETA